MNKEELIDDLKGLKFVVIGLIATSKNRELKRAKRKIDRMINKLMKEE